MDEARLILTISRVEFTADDDEHLVQYLATHLPKKSAGGRTGLEPYRRLVDLVRSHLPLVLLALTVIVVRRKRPRHLGTRMGQTAYGTVMA